LINRKDQLLKAAYYEVARNEAKVGELPGRTKSSATGPRNSYELIFALVCFSVSVSAQSNPFSDDARRPMALFKPSLMKAAEKMAEEDYSFRHRAASPDLRAD